jgi:tRNA (mo5U34)-methyltransferase
MAPEAARELIARADFIWYQRFELAPGVYTPGERTIDFSFQFCDIPSDLSGKTVLDIGTTNGGAAFTLERRGASRVVAADIYQPTQYGFDQLREGLGSKVEFVQSSIYELASRLDEQFDIVLFWGVLYHLRHPLLALDNLRALTRGYALLETEVADHELGENKELKVARYYRRDELSHDPSIWFSPTIACLLDWCSSCGLDPELVGAWPEPAAERCMLRLTPTVGAPEYRGMSYEFPLRVHVQNDLAHPDPLAAT